VAALAAEVTAFAGTATAEAWRAEDVAGARAYAASIGKAADINKLDPPLSSSSSFSVSKSEGADESPPSIAAVATETTTGAVPANVMGAAPANVTGAAPVTVTGAIPASVVGASLSGWRAISSASSSLFSSVNPNANPNPSQREAKIVATATVTGRGDLGSMPNATVLTASRVLEPLSLRRAALQSLQRLPLFQLRRGPTVPYPRTSTAKNQQHHRHHHRHQHYYRPQ
jgi:hypothetical protein